MFKVSSNFIAIFKIGDNINHNLKSLCLLYELCEQDTSRLSLLHKPIILILVSIAEAMLYDFITRIQSIEHVATLPNETINALKEKDYSNLTNLVNGARAHNLFSADEKFYEQLDELRKLRNRVHIQNEKNHFERDESQAFNQERQFLAESALEYISKFLASEHPRKSNTHGFVENFEFPWKEHWRFSS